MEVSHKRSWPLKGVTLTSQFENVFSPAPGQANATFCPHGFGCRGVLISENQIILDVTDHEVLVTVRVPDDRTLWLVSSLQP